MLVWLAVSAHLVFPSERLSLKRTVCLIFAVLGVALAFVRRLDEGESHLIRGPMALFGAFS